MSPDEDLLVESADELFENAPCGYLATHPDGTILKVNRTFEAMTGRDRDELVGAVRFHELLAPGARIYHETHFAPLLRMQGHVREIAVEIVRADGSRLPALVNAELVLDGSGEPRVVRTTVFDASDRRRYEQELLAARRREQDIALRLQRSMLSGTLPASPRVGLDVAYRPAVAELEIGGDWYDAFWLREPETVGLVVGDVVGRGIEAAATMGQLRSAIRALASTGLSPGPLLEALDGVARRHGIGRMATVVCAELDLASGELRYACAGHPPPVVMAPGAAPHVIWDGRSTPLDCATAPTARSEGRYTLSVGSTVMLYTDGLIERRSSTLVDGIDRLLAAVAALAEAPADGLSDAILRRLRDEGPPDDVCLLTARLTHGAAA